eukprot:1145049-Pelagomonas_calceolata.AAC.1
MRIRQVAVSHAPVGVDSPPPALNRLTPSEALARRTLQEDCVETRSGLGTLELLAQLTVAAVGLPAGHQASCLRSI